LRDDDVVQVQFVGSGDAFGSGGRLQTCIRLSAAGQTLLVDCGASSLVGLKAQRIDPSTIDVVVVTHLHGDHFGGLPFLVLDGQFSRRSTPLVVAGPPGIRARLAEAMEVLFPGSSRVERRFPLEVVELALDGTPVDLHAATVRGWEVKHACGAPPLAGEHRTGRLGRGRPCRDEFRPGRESVLVTVVGRRTTVPGTRHQWRTP
jgi:ribonuclease BN (tRNA processing enzyme)